MDGIQRINFPQVAFAQENQSFLQSESQPNASQEPVENETDFPVGNFSALGNLSDAELGHLASNAMTPPENATQPIPGINATIPGEQFPTNETILSENATQPLTEAPAANNLTTGLVCADGSLPDVNGLCPDGNPPPPTPGAANVTQAPAANNLTTGLVCADGSLPDVNGLCPDGNPPPPAPGTANVTQAPAANNLTGQVCADGSLPDVNGLCPDGNPPPAPAANVSQPGVPGQVCADGSLPDVNGLCPDGNPPPV
jgi:hypothetical protein